MTEQVVQFEQKTTCLDAQGGATGAVTLRCAEGDFTEYLAHVSQSYMRHRHSHPVAAYTAIRACRFFRHVGDDDIVRALWPRSRPTASAIRIAENAVAAGFDPDDFDWRRYRHAETDWSKMPRVDIPAMLSEITNRQGMFCERCETRHSVEAYIDFHLDNDGGYGPRRVDFQHPCCGGHA